MASLLLLSNIFAIAEEIQVSDVEAKYTNNAQVDAQEELKQSINLGFSNTTGNTEVLNLNALYKMSFMTTGYNENPLKVAFDASAILTEDSDTRINEEYIANLGLEQTISHGWLGYTAVNWLRNPDFKNYENKISVGMGLGKELFNDGKHSLKAKLGVAYNIEDYANSQKSEKFASLNEYIEYNNKLNKVSDLYVKVGAKQNFEDFSNDTEVLATLGVNFAVAENINVSIEEEIFHDSLPPAGFNKTDTKTIVRVGYNF